MLTLFEKLRALPASLTTAAQRAAWDAFATQSMPELPLEADGTVAPARVLSSGTHNDEGPTLYVAHPHRVFTRAREVASGRNASVGIATFQASPFRSENSGWNYAINAAALLGLTDVAAAQLAQRATTQPAAGYRFPAYAPHLRECASCACAVWRLFPTHFSSFTLCPTHHPLPHTRRGLCALCRPLRQL